MTTKPSDYLKLVVGKAVVVKLNSGVEYHGVDFLLCSLCCLDVFDRTVRRYSRLPRRLSQLGARAMRGVLKRSAEESIRRCVHSRQQRCVRTRTRGRQRSDAIRCVRSSLCVCFFVLVCASFVIAQCSSSGARLVLARIEMARAVKLKQTFETDEERVAVLSRVRRARRCKRRNYDSKSSNWSDR